MNKNSGRPPRHPLSRLTPLRGRGIRRLSFVNEVLENGDSGILQEEENARYFLFKWFLMILVRVFFRVVILFLPVLTI